LIMLLLVNFGFGNQIPVNPHAIRGRARTLKLFLLFFANVLMYLFISGLALVLIVRFFGGFTIVNGSTISLFGHPNLVSAFNLMLHALLLLNLQLCIVYTILAFVNMAMYGLHDEGLYGIGQFNWSLLLLSLLMWLVLFDPLARLLNVMLQHVELHLNHLFGLL